MWAPSHSTTNHEINLALFFLCIEYVQKDFGISLKITRIDQKRHKGQNPPQKHYLPKKIQNLKS